MVSRPYKVRVEAAFLCRGIVYSLSLDVLFCFFYDKTAPKYLLPIVGNTINAWHTLHDNTQITGWLQKSSRKRHWLVRRLSVFAVWYMMWCCLICGKSLSKGPETSDNTELVGLTPEPADFPAMPQTVLLCTGRPFVSCLTPWAFLTVPRTCYKIEESTSNRGHIPKNN